MLTLGTTKPNLPGCLFVGDGTRRSTIPSPCKTSDEKRKKLVYGSWSMMADDLLLRYWWNSMRKNHRARPVIRNAEQGGHELFWQNSRLILRALPLILFIILWGVGSIGAAIVTDFPLDPPDTSSPRATMDSFLSNMQEAHEQFLKTLKMYKEDPGWYQSPAVNEQWEIFAIFFRRAQRCLNMSEIPPTLVHRVGVEATVLLKTIFDRISIPALESIPDADEMTEQELTRWRVPNTEITITQVSEGPRVGRISLLPRDRRPS